MKIAVCCKITPDTSDVRIDPQGAVDLSRAQWGVSEYDLQAIQAAMDIASETDGEVVCVTVGGSKVSESKNVKALLARGPHSLLSVEDETLDDADTATTASVLAAAVQHIGADIVLFGEGSSDRYCRQVGAYTGEKLGWATLNCVDGISLEGNQATVKRDMEDGIQTCRVSLPCALSVTSTINTPQLPSMKAILGAGKKPVEKLSLADLGVAQGDGIEVVGAFAPADPDRKRILVEGSAEEMAAQLVAYLRQEEVL